MGRLLTRAPCHPIPRRAGVELIFSEVNFAHCPEENATVSLTKGRVCKRVHSFIQKGVTCLYGNTIYNNLISSEAR